MGSWDVMDNPTVPWDRGMGWTVGHTCICRGTGGMSHCPMGVWDGMDNLRHFWTSMVGSDCMYIRYIVTGNCFETTISQLKINFFHVFKQALVYCFGPTTAICILEVNISFSFST